MVLIPRINCSALLRSGISICLIVTMWGCDDSTAPPAAAEVVSNVILPLSSRVNTVVVPSPSVTVRDARGNPLAGVPVLFAIDRGNGVLLGDSAVTNSEGIAGVISWRLGRIAGPNTVVATVVGIPPVTIEATAVAGEPWSMEIVAGNNQTVIRGEPVPVRPSVMLRDFEGNTVPGAIVTFTGEGVTEEVQVTDSGGIATVGEWRPPKAGSQTLEASHTLLIRRFFSVTVLADP